MKTEPFIIEQSYNATVSKVWKAITDKDEMRNDILCFSFSFKKCKFE